MARQRHIHKYRKLHLKFRNIWSCALDDCSHHMPHDLTDKLIGKASLCWRCGEKFILDEDNMKDDMPVCYNCKPSTKSVMDLLDKFGVK